MALFETWVNRDLKKIMTAEDIRGTVFTLDNLGNLIGVRVFSDGVPVELSGSVNGYCILADGTTVPVAGTRSGNEAYIILPQSAYAVPGMIRIAIKLTDGSAITTLAAMIGSVAMSRTDNMITPSSQVITDWSQQIAASLQENADLVAQSVKYGSSQSLTDAQKQTARTNIGAASAVELAAEATARENADSDLNSAIEAEATARENADSNLKNAFNGNNEHHYSIIKNNANAFPTFYPGELLSTEQNGVASFNGGINTGDSTFRRAVASVEQGKRYIISGTEFNNFYPAYLLLKGTTIVKCVSLVNSDSETVFVEEIICVDADADTIWVNGNTGHVEVREALSLGYEEIFEHEVSIGCVLPGVINNDFNIVFSDSPSFSCVVAPVRKGGVYYITGTQFPLAYPAYVLLKAGQVVGHDTIPSGTTPSSESFFSHHEITVSVDADELIVNGYRNSCSVEIKLSESRKPAADPVYDWKQVEAPVLNGVRDNNGYNENVGSHCIYMVRPGETVRLHSRQWLSPFYPLFVCLRNDVFVNRNPIEYPTDTWQIVEYTIPNNVNCIILNGYSMSEPPTLWRKLPVDTKEYIDSKVEPYNKLSSSNYWEGKKIVWFGTSIPAGGANPGDTAGNGSYPLRVGEMLGATVYNEAVGSSCVRYGNYAFATENDPHGLAGQWLDNFLYSLAGSTEEKQTVFNNWSYWKTVIQSGQVSGVTLTDAQKSKALECCYDNKLYKYLTGGSVGPVDLYVFDHGHNEEYRGDYDNMKTIPPAGHEKDRSYFIGAMRFIIEKILTDNPRAKICFIGHYQNDIKTGVSEAQLELANIWKYPLCKTWELIGWSQNTVTINGETKTLTQIWMPDNLHPSSDPTGKALKHYAEVLYPFMRDVR